MQDTEVCCHSIEMTYPTSQCVVISYWILMNGKILLFQTTVTGCLGSVDCCVEVLPARDKARETCWHQIEWGLNEICQVSTFDVITLRFQCKHYPTVWSDQAIRTGDVTWALRTTFITWLYKCSANWTLNVSWMKGGWRSYLCRHIQINNEISNIYVYLLLLKELYSFFYIHNCYVIHIFILNECLYVQTDFRQLSF